MKFKIGDKVTYTFSLTPENGIVKSIKGDRIFVVFECGGDWDNSQQYTAAGVSPNALQKGWANCPNCGGDGFLTSISEGPDGATAFSYSERLKKEAEKIADRNGTELPDAYLSNVILQSKADYASRKLALKVFDNNSKN